MAEDNTNSSVSSEPSGKNESDGGKPIKTSTEKARRLSNVHGVLPSDSLSSRGSDDGISSRRYSTGKQNPADKSNLPHYLRASTGSCHDFCKYGREHSFESKPPLPLSRRIKRPHHRKLDSVGPTVGEGTKVSDHSRDPEVHFPPPPEIIKEVVFLEPKVEVEPSPRQQHDSSSDKMIPKTDTKIKNMPVKVKWSPPMQRPRAKVLKQSSVSKSLDGLKPAARRVSDIGSGRKSDIMSCEKNCDTKTGRKTLSPKASLPRVIESPSASPTSFVSKSLNTRKRMDKVKNKNRIEEADTKTEEEKVSEKTLHVIEMEPKGDLVEPAQDGEIMEDKDDDDDVIEPAQDGEILAPLSPPSPLLPESSLTSNSRDLQIEKRNPRESLTKAKKPVVSKLDAPSPVKLKFRRGKVVDIRQENNAPRRLSFRKRTLLGKNQDSKTEAKGKLVESMHDGQKISSREKGGQDGKEGSGLANIKGDDNKPSLNTKGVKSAGRTQNKTSKNDNPNPIVTRVDNPLPVKLKFKRGTVVNPQHESPAPRRLGFGKIKHLRENQGISRSDVKKSSKKRVESGENSMSLNPGKVVLRHQDVQQGKKDAQGLFNNVIEETASKLVETKKSKVKALVGAFETVISLQEKKPSAHAVS